MRWDQWISNADRLFRHEVWIHGSDGVTKAGNAPWWPLNQLHYHLPLFYQHWKARLHKLLRNVSYVGQRLRSLADHQSNIIERGRGVHPLELGLPPILLQTVFTYWPSRYWEEVCAWPPYNGLIRDSWG